MVGIIIISVTKMLMYTIICRRTNESIHNSMISGLVRTTIQFFETNDSGTLMFMEILIEKNLLLHKIYQNMIYRTNFK